MRRLLTVLGLLASLVLAACGGDDGGAGDETRALVERAVAASKEPESYRARTDLKAGFGGERVELSGTVVSSMDERRQLMDVKYAEGGASPQAMEILAMEGRGFVRGEAIDAALPPGKRWLEVENDAPTALPLSDLLRFLEQGGDLEVKGEEEVAGGPATHVHSPLDLEELAEEASSELAKRFAKLGGDKLEAEIDVWISKADDRIRKLDLKITAKRGEGQADIVSEILEYDVPLDKLELPAEAVVVTEDALRGG